MHRIGIISDTHGLLRPEVSEVLHSCEAILHGGDINCIRILDELNRIAPTYAVRGNNDKEWAKELPGKLFIELYGIRFYMVHNRKYIEAGSENADVIVYGHSHKYEERYKGSTLYINPGSCGPRRFTQPITFALLIIEDDHSFRAEKVEIPHREKGKGTPGDTQQNMEEQMKDRDMRSIVKSVMRDTDKHIPVEEIALKNHISGELAELICRLYLTHPGVNADGILGKMGL